MNLQGITWYCTFFYPLVNLLCLSSLSVHRTSHCRSTNLSTHCFIHPTLETVPVSDPLKNMHKLVGLVYLSCGVFVIPRILFFCTSDSPLPLGLTFTPTETQRNKVWFGSLYTWTFIGSVDKVG